MRGSHDGTEIVRILHSIQDNNEFRPYGNRFKVGIRVRGRECDHTLMIGFRRCAIQSFARFKTDERSIATAKVHDFLNALPACPARDEHMIQTPACAQRLAHRMNSCDNVHETRLRSFAAGYWKFMSEPAEVYELPITVEAPDIDQQGHVNNVTYVRWVQDVAVAHWTHAASAEDQAKFFWVVVRHEIDYKRPAVMGDRVIARTWVGAASRIRFERHTEIVRARDGVVLAKALTVWCPMDSATGRPAAVSAGVRERFSVNGEAG